MSLIAHLLFALVYTVAAIAVALTLPYSVPSVDRPTALFAGAIIFLFGAILHEVASRQQRDRSLARWLARLRSGDEELAAGLDRLNAELRDLRAGGTVRPAPAAVTGSVSDTAALVAELRALRQLVDRPSEARGPKPAADGATGTGSDVPPDGVVMEAVRAASGASGPSGPEKGSSEQGLPEQAAGNPAVLAAVRAALTGDRIEAYVQPVVTLPQRKHRFYQVTARLLLDGGQEIGPEVYLPVARRDGRVAFIDNLLLFRAIQLLREADRRSQQVGFFCVVTADSLADRAFVSQFAQFMTRNTVLADKLMFELPQGELFDDASPARATLDELGRLGFRFVMGDVAHLDFDAVDLVERHVRFVKLPAALLLDAPSPLGGLDAALALKHELERDAMDLIIDGIGSEQELVELLDLRPDFGQGDLFGEPRPARRPG
ncbi:MAG TPA: EAL domain-containing protein [Arenibaculum sp.]|nr:EAL domain-containing protein [Arenibaculum sp.]